MTVQKQMPDREETESDVEKRRKKMEAKRGKGRGKKVSKQSGAKNKGEIVRSSKNNPDVHLRKSISNEPALIAPSLEFPYMLQGGFLQEVDTPIKSDRDIIGLLKNIDNVDYLQKKLFSCDGTQIKIKLQGDNFNASLPGSLITALAEYQNKIYRAYLINKHGANTKYRLTPGEAKQFEIKVTVKEGSTEALIEFAYKVIKEAMTVMTPEQVSELVQKLAGMAIVGLSVIGVGSVAVVQAFKTVRKSIALKKARSKDEVEKRKIEAQESTINMAIGAIQEMGRGIVQSSPKNVMINDKIIPIKKIEALTEHLEPEEPEVLEEQSVVKGVYRIKRVTMDFYKETASVDIYDIETQNLIKGVVIQQKSISDGSYSVLKKAQEKEELKLQLIITTRNDRICKTVLDKILE